MRPEESHYGPPHIGMLVAAEPLSKLQAELRIGTRIYGRINVFAVASGMAFRVLDYCRRVCTDYRGVYRVL